MLQSVPKNYIFSVKEPTKCLCAHSGAVKALCYSKVAIIACSLLCSLVAVETLFATLAQICVKGVSNAVQLINLGLVYNKLFVLNCRRQT